jgi:hypothetical protein
MTDKQLLRRDLLEKLTVGQASRTVSAFYKTRCFITVFARVGSYSEPDEFNLRHILYLQGPS